MTTEGVIEDFKKSEMFVKDVFDLFSHMVNTMIPEGATWIQYNFPNSPGNTQVVGMLEEYGELCHAVLKMSQGIRGNKEELTNDLVDAAADVVIFMNNYLSWLKKYTNYTVDTESFLERNACIIDYSPVEFLINYKEPGSSDVLGFVIRVGRLVSDFCVRAEDINEGLVQGVVPEDSQLDDLFANALVILGGLKGILLIYEVAPILDVTKKIWEEVSERDWIKFPQNGISL